jgi:CheY-like chemotaxis protein
VTEPAPDEVILVVEDERESRETLRELLEFEGYTVETAANGREALEILNRVEPCVVLLDLFMPVMDGWQVLERLRDDHRLAKLNVVVITSAVTNTPADVPVLTKPLDLDRLMQTVEAAC